uniref:Tektin n=1 Tax=Dicyema japonicum TaxID=399803 RepID=A2V6Z7_DICJA|nr:tektin B [Dicyema japonicum]
MSTMLKNTLKYTVPDWFTRNYTVSTNTDRQCEAACNVRQQCISAQNDTQIDTKWDQFNSTSQLTNRIEGILKWKHKLAYTQDNLETEIEQLQEAKNLAEASLTAMNKPNTVNVGCATVRDARMNSDLVNDLPTMHLQKENRLIEICRSKLQQKIDDAFQLEALLKESRQQLLSDIVDKDNAINIDTNQRNLRETSQNIYLKSDSKSVPSKSVTPHDWDDYSTFNKSKAESLIELSKTLRQDIIHTINQTSNDLEYQQNQTDLALRNRVHEYKQATDQLEWQKKRLEDEIRIMEDQVNSLEKSIADKYPFLKLAETRLNNRTKRQHVELCRDSPQYALIHEVKQLEGTIDYLTDAYNQSKHTLNCLQEQLYQTNQELECKANSLELDRKCIKLRTPE